MNKIIIFSLLILLGLQFKKHTIEQNPAQNDSIGKNKEYIKQQPEIKKLDVNLNNYQGNEQNDQNNQNYEQNEQKVILKAKKKQYNQNLDVNNDKLKGLYVFPMKKNITYYDSPLFNIQQVAFTISLQFGSEKQPIDVAIDTGSADLWVYDSNCQGCKYNVPKYDCSSSKTCIKSNERIYINYDDGPIQGNIAFDDVYINISQDYQNDGTKQILLKNQSFSLMDYSSQNMVNSQGLLGIGPSALEQNPYPQVLDNLVSQGVIEEEEFSIYLSNIDGDYSSRLIFGGYDENYIADGQEIIYADILTMDAYLIAIDGIKLGNQFINFRTALIDSGTSCMTFPRSIMSNFQNYFKNNGINCKLEREEYAPAYSMFNCVGKISDFPDVVISISNQELVFTPKDYIYECYSLKDDAKDNDNILDEDLFCMTKFEQSSIDFMIILGDGFMESYYTIFRPKQKRIGFAKSINIYEDIKITNLDDYLRVAILKNHKRETLANDEVRLQLWKIDLLICLIVILCICGMGIVMKKAKKELEQENKNIRNQSDIIIENQQLQNKSNNCGDLKV